MIVVEQIAGTNVTQLQREIIEVSPSVVRIFDGILDTTTEDASEWTASQWVIKQADFGKFQYIVEIPGPSIQQEILLNDSIVKNSIVVIKVSETVEIKITADTDVIIPPQGYTLTGSDLILELEEFESFALIRGEDTWQVV